MKVRNVGVISLYWEVNDNLVYVLLTLESRCKETYNWILFLFT